MRTATLPLVAAVFLALLTSGCASQISTSNAVITTVCEVQQADMLGTLREVVAGMRNYSYTPKSATVALVKYDPSGPLMGSATIQVQASPASGLTREGQRVTGFELVYTDVTPLMSQDTSFGGGEIIALLKSSFDELAQFKGMHCVVVRRG